MRLGVKALSQYCDNARFAETGFAGDEYDLAFPCLGTRPVPHQQVDLLVATNQSGQDRAALCLEAAGDGARTQHLPGRHRLGDTLDLEGAKITIFEEIADQSARCCSDDDRVRPGEGLQASGEVGRFADDRLFLCRAFAD